MGYLYSLLHFPRRIRNLAIYEGRFEYIYRLEYIFSLGLEGLGDLAGEGLDLKFWQPL